MSETASIRVICEGPTDTIVIRSAVEALGIEAVITQIQPEDNSNLLGAQTLGPHGGGWKGVRKWCAHAVATGTLKMAQANAHALVIHVDADIAHEKEISCAEPCPPARATTNAVRSTVLGWLETPEIPEGVVLCVPAASTEAWVFCALSPKDKLATDIECRPDPAALLVPKKLVTKKGKSYKKNLGKYKQVLPLLVEGWKDSIPRLCGEGARFIAELRAQIP